MSTANEDEEREWLRTFPKLRQLLDQPDESGWCDSSTRFRAYDALEDYVLLATAHSWCDDCSWDKKWDCSSFYAIMRDGTLQGSFVEKDECLAVALKRMPELPQRVIRITFNGAGRGPSPDDGYSEGTHVASYRLDGEADWPSRLERILATKKKEPTG